MADVDRGRHAGVIVPLFSIPSRRSWGIGEIPDLPRFARWVAAAGMDVIQLLPVNEMSDGQSSPYSALSAMAIDPLFIAIADVHEFAADGGEASLTAEDASLLNEARRAPSVQHPVVRELKRRVLRTCFERFDRMEWQPGTQRAAEFNAFCARESWWMDEYSLFRALHDEEDLRYWLEWEPGIRARQPDAVAAARTRLADDIRYFSWLQWIACEQWARARLACAPVAVFGDFPFMVSGDSADVWSRQHEFRVDASVGVPPDAFSATGQDWGLPAYRWDVMAPQGYEWLHQRARRCAHLFNGFRVDHLVGFYRTFVREADGTTRFIPEGESAQLAQGERLLDLFESSGAQIVVEDLGTVPDFVRASIARRQVPGLKVLRWERDWHAEHQPFIDPAAYPVHSVATSGTHDTETLAEWWETAPPEERAAAARIPALAAAGCTSDQPYSDELRDAFISALFAARSLFGFLPIQDIFGWRDRINTPAVVDDSNWSWRLPWPVEDMLSNPAAVERARQVRALAALHGRGLTGRSADLR